MKEVKPFAFEVSVRCVRGNRDLENRSRACPIGVQNFPSEVVMSAVGWTEGVCKEAE